MIVPLKALEYKVGPNAWFEGPEFFAKIIAVFNNFLPKKI